MYAESQNYEARRDKRYQRKGSINTPVDRKWLSRRRVMIITDTQATIEELLQSGVFRAVRVEAV
jgi:hypothetical protein